LIVFPEGQSLAQAQYYALIDAAFEQCRLLQDRFVLVDVHTRVPALPAIANTTQTIAGFRGAFTRTTNLNYGAAYYPNLRTTYNYNYRLQNVQVTITTNGTAAPGVPLSTLEQSQTAIFNLCQDRIRTQLNPILPPTPAMAGVYAQVDDSRGVWKAPANVSLNAVQDLTDFITEAEQGDMNIDPCFR
jgi:phage tail sheath protein FI